jgi:hypothetical protein
MTATLDQKDGAGVGVDPPDPSERVNVYLPKSLIGRIDRSAAERGMSRSSFSGSPPPRRCCGSGLSCKSGGGALEGAQDRRIADWKIVGQKAAALNGADN